MLLLVALTLAAALAGGLVWATRSKSGTPHLAPLESNYSVDEAQDFTQFPIYYAGESVNGYPLTAVERDTNPTQVISFLYGDCTPPVDSDGHYDGGCGLPVEVQVRPACFRNPELYGGPGSPTPDKTTVRGVPAAFYEGGNRLEIQTGTSTVVIFANSPASVADALRGVNNNVSSGEDLPAPAAGVVTGDLKC